MIRFMTLEKPSSAEDKMCVWRPVAVAFGEGRLLFLRSVDSYTTIFHICPDCHALLLERSPPGEESSSSCFLESRSLSRRSLKCSTSDAAAASRSGRAGKRFLRVHDAWRQLQESDEGLCAAVLMGSQQIAAAGDQLDLVSRCMLGRGCWPGARVMDARSSPVGSLC